MNGDKWIQLAAAGTSSFDENVRKSYLYDTRYNEWPHIRSKGFRGVANVDKKDLLTLLDEVPTEKKEEGWQRHNHFTQDGGSWGCDHKLQETINGMSKPRIKKLEIKGVMRGNQIHVFGEAAGHKGTDGPNRVGAHKRPKRSHPTKNKSVHYFSVVLVRDSSLNATFGVCTYPTWGPPQGLF
ncbi:unnamed protein product [Sphenostylis stenocarpa]|uniref:Uncharacterized protein n=1 Tax=Sphenostylis stenocarpa TaxID=92480 RepID=A0AA86VM96_9FABA|nr:unnamed protein product [Sphenostylis stenocarpa]